MARKFQVVFDCADPRRLGTFWADALGYVEDPPPEGFSTWEEALTAWGLPEEEWNRAYAVVDPEGAGPRVFLQRVPEGKVVKNRVHLDIRISDPSLEVADQEAQIMAEVERLEALGARRVAWTAEIGKHFMVMVDIEDNEFCLT